MSNESMASLVNELATAKVEPAKEKGIALPCPRCLQEDASIRLNLYDCETFMCMECEEEFTATDIRYIMERWYAVLKWIDEAPRF